MEKQLQCPIYFENHQFGGHVSSIENFTNMDLGMVRTTFLNGKPYFSATDLCRGLQLNTKNTFQFVNEAVSDIVNNYYNPSVEPRDNGNIFQPGMSYIDQEELYFYIAMDISHNIGNSDKIVTQKINALFVSEPVLYMLTFRSRKKEALSFKAWLAVDILPKLRMIGQDNTTMLIDNEYGKLLDALKKIDSIYEGMKSFKDAKEFELNAINTLMENHKYKMESLSNIQNMINTLYYKLNGLEYADGCIINNTNVLNEKVTDVASGLNYIFGRSIKQ